MSHEYEYKRIRTKNDNASHKCDVRNTADNITDKLDRQAVENFELNLQVNKYRSELKHALQQLEEHSYCPGEVDILCDSNQCSDKCQSKQLAQDTVEPQHGDDCHCSKCCPNPNPNFFKKHKFGLLMGLIWAILLVLAIGWAPSGSVADAVNTSWVELIVNFFKMALFAIAGIATYNLVKKSNE